MNNVFGFGDEWSDISDCNSDSCEEGLFLCLLYSDESESESDKAYPPLLLLMFASLFTEV
jgi:hypothetical protein